MDGLMEEGQSAIQRLPTKAFGYTFTDIPDDIREDLFTLEREGIVYTDHWIDEIGDFRHVRIRFTVEEQKEYARRSWAYELWLRAATPEWARDTPGIDQDVAIEADAYVMHTVDGDSFGPPYHCFAGFLGSHLESLVCSNERIELLELEGRNALLFEVERGIRSLTPTIRSFNTRERGLAPWSITREDDVRDLLYVMLRPRIFDLTKEESVPSRAGTHKFVDLCSKAVRLLIEVKWISRPGQWKRVVEETYVDVQSYVAHPACETLVFVIVDTARDIPDPSTLERQLSGEQTIDGKAVQVRFYVAEP